MVTVLSSDVWIPYSVSFCVLPPQDQLSADMYSFVAKEIDYANYFQTVSIQKGEAASGVC